MRIAVSEAANADLDGIFDHGAAMFGQAAAEAYIRRFQAVYDLISEHVLIGAVNDSVRLPIRSVTCGNYRVYYHVLADHMVVRHILRKAMNVERYL